jgi:hypothetical protein
VAGNGRSSPEGTHWMRVPEENGRSEQAAALPATQLESEIESSKSVAIGGAQPRTWNRKFAFRLSQNRLGIASRRSHTESARNLGFVKLMGH